MSVALPHPFWCAICRQRPVTHHGDACPGCIGSLDVSADPIAWPALAARPRHPWWARAWAWLENHLPDWTADPGGEDE